MTPRAWTLGMAALLLLAGFVPAFTRGHPATEPYIPIGQSPGLSGVETYIGRIRRVDDDAQVLTVESESGERGTIRITSRTGLWLDRSKRGRPPEVASFDDCRRGRRIEARFYRGSREADWVKIESR